MCYSPLKIANNTRYFSTRHDKLFNLVPCGHCGECMQRKQNDWIVRSYYEWKQAQSSGGFALFVTMTYNNDYLPTITIKGDTVPGFYKPDVQKYHDALKKRIKRKYGKDTLFRFITTSEYGGVTHRPHYHSLLIVHKAISPFWLRKQISDLWSYGFVKFGNNFGIVDGLSGIKYVAKYICKDLDFYDDRLNDNIKVVPDIVYSVKSRYAPFHLQSKGFGECINYLLDPELLVLGKVYLPHQNGYKLYHLPLYNERKLFYTLDPITGSYRLSEQGYYMKSVRQENNYYLTKKYIQGLHSNLDWIDPLSLDIININFPNFKSAYDVKTSFNQFFKQYSYDDFIDYLTNERDFCYLSDDYFQGVVIGKPYNYLARCRKYLDECSPPLYSDYSYNPETKKYLQQNSFNELNTELETFAQLFDTVRFLYGKYRQNYFAKKQKEKSKLKAYAM